MAHFAKQNAAALGGGLFLRFEANWQALLVVLCQVCSAARPASELIPRKSLREWKISDGDYLWR
jgi:hypothetical protein